MRIAMVGSGYVGLVSGACFAQFGHDVVCVDKDPAKIAQIKAGNMPIYEPGLDRLVADNVKAGRLDFSTDLAAAVGTAEREAESMRGRQAHRAVGGVVQRALAGFEPFERARINRQHDIAIGDVPGQRLHALLVIHHDAVGLCPISRTTGLEFL